MEAFKMYSINYPAFHLFKYRVPSFQSSRYQTQFLWPLERYFIFILIYTIYFYAKIASHFTHALSRQTIFFAANQKYFLVEITRF